MKISDLSEQTGVPVPTIKFYLREGLIPTGQKTGRNQALYGADHVERLALIRSLTHDAGLSLEQVAHSLRAADRAKGDFVIAAIDALKDTARAELDPSSEAFRRAKRTVLALARQRGWLSRTSDVSVDSAASALAVALRGMPQAVDTAGGGTPCAPVAGAVTPESLSFYAQAMEAIVEHEVPADWQPESRREAALRYAVLGTVLFEPFIIALRRMAHVSRTRSLAAKHRQSRRS
ncbi:MAG: MerR family transcriptional regulator [Myxococcales bacterium]